MSPDGYAKIARKKTEEAVAAEAARQAALADHEGRYQIEKKKLEAGGITELFQKSWKGIIDKASFARYQQVVISLGSTDGHNQDPRPETRALIEVGTKFLEEEGFTVSLVSKNEYSGTRDDPTTTFTLRVSW